ncbi:polyhydroxyalkanoic acid system family protein [Hyphomicrobium sp. NDB2Meth4]|uniref:polyhydroxyalkanoic acid system family protein n=1 Tax=Hyphomicrobium sp. NDB2Meth4 TaxID=1892846 RepID=UPI00093037A6|nr:polyhydroxyalkanoic acid system family protein [Hyphomicrobium sp. NDB2Meth4]
MAEPLVVSIPHSLGKTEAMRRLQSGLQGVPSSSLLTLEQQPWIENKMPFTVRAMGQSIPGSLEVGEDVVRLEVVLPALLKKLWGPLKETMIGRAKLLLEKK